jgi:hypothetical protein
MAGVPFTLFWRDSNSDRSHFAKMNSFLSGWAIAAIIYIGFAVSYKMGIAILDHKYLDALLYEAFYIATVMMNLLMVFILPILEEEKKKRGKK